jgi:hypothetical protein
VSGLRMWYQGGNPALVLSGGATRVVIDDPAPEGWKPPRFGFAPPPREVEPLLWEGDQA